MALHAGTSSRLFAQLESGPPAVVEAAVCTINALVQSNNQLAPVLCNLHTLHFMVMLLQGAACALGLKRAVVNTLGNVCSMNAESARMVVEVRCNDGQVIHA